jgi:uncharacterized protein (TIGR03083 family)
MDRVVAGLEQLWAATIKLLEGLTPDEWSRPTPCADWDVRELAAHLAAGQGLFEGLPQPNVPPGWSTDRTGIDAQTAEMVAARHDWPPERVLEELRRATGAQLERFGSLDDAGWTAPSAGPPGVNTVAALARNRLLDGYIHLLDLRVALDRPLDLDAEPVAFAECVAQAREFCGWGAVKKASLPDGSRVRIELTGPAGSTNDLVVEGRRGALVDPEAGTAERVEGTSAAFLFVATARPQWTGMAGGIDALGPQAEQLLAGYVIWA